MKKFIQQTYSTFYQKQTSSFKDKVFAVIILFVIMIFSVFALAQAL